MSTIAFLLTLPDAADDLGRWMDANGACLSLSCSLGTYTATVDMKKLHSYSDDAGEHAEHWSVSRHARDMGEAVRSAFKAAMEIRASAR